MNRMVTHVMSGGGVGRDGMGLFTANVNMRLQDLIKMFKLKLTRILAQSSVSGRGWWRDPGEGGHGIPSRKEYIRELRNHTLNHYNSAESLSRIFKYHD